MRKVFLILLTVVIVSFYYFPFEFSFLPDLNTKMCLAVVGIFISILSFVQKKEMLFPQNVAKIGTAAIVVSMIGVVSVVLNNTSDYLYATYFVSMAVWLGGAYAVCYIIKAVHKTLTIENVTMYITGVCILQCVMALVINSNVSVKNFIDTYVIQGQSILDAMDRLYGIGASLDTAGVRFSACLIMLTFIIAKNKGLMGRWQNLLSIVAFAALVVIGNMVARTTSVGLLLSAMYVLITFRPNHLSKGMLNLITSIVVVLLLIVPLCVYLYNNNPQFHQLSRFAFEGFFSLTEKGEWRVGSNEMLKSMVIFPENIKTWLIGDGYFLDPYETDPTYVGQYMGGYYMGTDIGYLRFIFYFGIIGLISFSIFFILVAKECAYLLPKYKLMILFILLLGFIIWMKVSTDVFAVFALLLCVGNMQDEPPQLEEEEV